MLHGKSRQRKKYSPWPFSSDLNTLGWMLFNSTVIPFPIVLFESQILTMVFNHTEILIHKNQDLIPKWKVQQIDEN